VDRVDYLGGATFSINDKMEKGFGGFTLGSYINIGTSHSIEGDLRDNLEKYPTLMHEYGHSIDSQRKGLAYLLVIALPSFISAWWDEKSSEHNHKSFYTETIANKLANHYFMKYYGIVLPESYPLP